MSTTKSAGIKLTLQSQGFSNGLKKSEDEAKKAGKGIGGALKSAMNDGLKAGLDSLKSTFSSVKDTILSLGGLVGSIGVADMLRTAVTTEAGFRKLSFAIRAGTGAGVDYITMQKQVQEIALKTGQATEDLGSTMAQVFKDTGDAKYAQESIETIATAATGTGEELHVLGAIAGTLQQKFGLTAKELPEALALVYAQANRGGASLEDLAEDFGELGGKAKSLGAVGPEGLRKMLALTNLAKTESGKFSQAMTALPALFDAILERGSDLKLKFGVQTVDASGKARDPFDIIRDIVTKSKGDRGKLAEMGFGGEALQTLMGMSKSFNGTLNKQGTNIKEAQASYDQALAAAAESTMKWNDIQLNASYETESTEKRFQVALEKLKATFSKPEITGAINKLAENLPKLAELIEKVVGFAVENPALAAGAVVGAQAGSAVIGGAAQSMLSAALQGAFSRGGTSAAAAVAEGLAGSAATSAGGGMAKGFLGALTGGTGLALVGAAIAAAFLVNSIQETDKFRDEEKAKAADAKTAFYNGGDGGSGAGNAPGMGGAGMNYERRINPSTGEEEIAPVDALEREQWLTEVMPSGLSRQEEMDQAKAQAFMAPPDDPLLSDPNAFMTPDDGSSASSFTPYSGEFAKGKPRGGGGGGNDPAFDARLFAEMMGVKELKVKVMNPEAIRGTSGPGSPTPGTVPRK